MITNATKLTAVIGNPVSHSMSPVIHNDIYAREKLDAVMLAFGHASVEKLVDAIRTLPIHLTAVTMPHKQTIIPLLDEVEAAAKKIGAVNTVINKDGILTGYNTDYVGIAAALKGATLKDAHVLLIGAGGAARPAAYLLSQEGANIYCLNRELAGAEDLCKTFGGTPVEGKQLNDISFDIIINATPVGMSPNIDASPISSSIIRSGALVFDFIYAPLETKLLREAKEKGARAVSGLTMFIAQALEQERLWLGREVSSRDYAPILIQALEGSKHV